MLVCLYMQNDRRACSMLNDKHTRSHAKQLLKKPGLEALLALVGIQRVWTLSGHRHKWARAVSLTRVYGSRDRRALLVLVRLCDSVSGLFLREGVMCAMFSFTWCRQLADSNSLA